MAQSRSSAAALRAASLIFLAIAVAPFLFPASAAAQDLPVEPLPGFMTLDRMDASSRFGLQVGFDKLDQVALSNGFGLRFDLYGQYVLPNRFLGIYGELPFSRLIVNNGDDTTGTGNLEMGVFFLPRHNSDLILRAGIAFPTASDSDSVSILANVFTVYERLTDLLLIAPRYTTLRLAVSTVQDTGTAFFRADLGMDLVLDLGSSGGTFTSNGDRLFLRGNLAAGVHLPGADLSVELVNLANPDASGDITDKLNHTAAVGLRTRGADQFHLGTVFPLDKGPRGNVWIVSVGYQRAL